MDFKLPQLPTDEERIKNALPYAKNSLNTWKHTRENLSSEPTQEERDFIEKNIDYFTRYVEGLENNLKKACRNK